MSDAVARLNQVRASATPAALRLRQGERALVSVSVENRGSVVDQFGLAVEGIGGEFFDVRVEHVSLFPGETGALTLEVHLPRDRVIAAGSEMVVLRVASRRDPRVAASIELPIEVQLIRQIEVELRPTQLKTRRAGRFRAFLTNAGNADQLVDVSVADPQEGLRYWLSHDRVAISPGETRVIEIRIRPRRRPIHGFPAYYPFTITAADPNDPEASIKPANGVLVFQPPLGWLGATLARLRALGVLLAILCLLLAALIWSLGAPGERPAETAARAAQQLEAAAPASRQDADLADATGVLTGGSGGGALQVAAGNPANSATPGQGAGAGAPAGSAAAPSNPPTPAPVATPNVPPPVIVNFDVGAAPPDALPGYIQLTWAVRNVEQVTIGGARLPASGTALVQGLSQGEIELVARNAAGTARRSVGVLVLRPPEIRQFTVTPPTTDAGQLVTLTWETVRAESVRVFGPDLEATGVVVDPLRGSMQVRPMQSATYTLRAENALGRVEEALPVSVGSASTTATSPPASLPTSTTLSR